MKRLLVTGATGFLGRRCVALALASGFEVWAVASSRNLSATSCSPGVCWRVCDLIEPGSIEAAISEIRPTHLLHLAWETTQGLYWASPANLDWLVVGIRMVKAFAACAGQRFVSAGTCAEYDENCGFVKESESPEHPSSFYGHMKLSHHKLLMASAEQFQFSAVTGRVFSVYGPFEKPDRLVPYICRHLSIGSAAKISNGHLIRDFLHVDDVAAGFISLLNSDISGPCNISSAKGIKLSDLAIELARLTGRTDLIKICNRNNNINRQQALIGSNELLRSTGWRQNIDLTEGLHDVLEWWQRR